MNKGFTMLLLMMGLWVIADAPQETSFTSSTFNHAVLEKMTIDMINNYRTRLNKQKLKMNSGAQKAAVDHANYIFKLGRLDHTQSDLRKKHVWDRMKFHTGRDFTSGENLAMLYVLQRARINQPDGTVTVGVLDTYEKTARALFYAWKASPMHDLNMRKGVYQFTGIHIKFDPNEKAIWICQVFGSEPG